MNQDQEMYRRTDYYTLRFKPPATRIRFDGPNAVSKTQQSFRQETNINEIIRRAIDTGEPPPFKPGGTYGDFSILTDYQTALQMVEDADKAFQALPAKVRKRFDNDPAQLLNFLNDPANYQEGVDLGFYEGPKEPKVTVPEGTVVTETIKTPPLPRG